MCLSRYSSWTRAQRNTRTHNQFPVQTISVLGYVVGTWPISCPPYRLTCIFNLPPPVTITATQTPQSTMRMVSQPDKCMHRAFIIRIISDSCIMHRSACCRSCVIKQTQAATWVIPLFVDCYTLLESSEDNFYVCFGRQRMTRVYVMASFSKLVQSLVHHLARKQFA